MFNLSLYGNQVPFTRKYVREALSLASGSADPMVIAELNHSHTEAHDIIRFIDHGAQIFISTTGVVLQNLVVRCSLNKMSRRPVLLWRIKTDPDRNQAPGQDYLLGEEVEACITGSDGVIFYQEDIIKGSFDSPGAKRPKSSGSGDFRGDSSATFSGSFSGADSSHTRTNSINDIDNDVINLRLSEFATKLRFCKDNGLTTVIKLSSIESLDVFLQDHLKPDVLFLEEPGIDLLKYTSRAQHKGVVFMNVHRLNSENNSENISEGFGQMPEFNAVVADDCSQLPKVAPPKYTPKPIVKVCGIKTVEAAQKALESGASMIGMILVPGRSRSVDFITAKQISSCVHNFVREPFGDDSSGDDDNGGMYTSDMLLAPGLSIFESRSRILQRRSEKRPMIVGVFRNQPLADILNLQKELGLDIVQLHGSEPLEWCKLIPVPVIKRFTPGTAEFQLCSLTDYHYLSLLDGEVGGEGVQQDWDSIREQVDVGARFLIAGGLNENNVHSAVRAYGAVGVDVSGGVETNGVKDLGKIERFVRNARGA